MNKKFVQKFLINNFQKGTRLDIFLTKNLDISRSQAQVKIKRGQVRVNDNLLTPGYILNEGDEIVMVEKEKQKALEVGVIYEDSDILVVNKPAGITVHPAPGEQEITVSEMFADSYQGKCNTDRDMIVHRLDKGTSGIMVLAKNEAARDSLIAQFAARMVIKKYIALVMGKVFPTEGVIDMPLARDSSVRNKMSPLETGKESKTLYKVIKLYDGYTLISASPKTGRTHQIRVHFAAIGHPLYGDSRYGKQNADINRIFLHAAEISITHPTTGKKLKFICDLPRELQEVLAKLPIE